MFADGIDNVAALLPNYGFSLCPLLENKMRCEEMRSERGTEFLEEIFVTTQVSGVEEVVCV